MSKSRFELNSMIPESGKITPQYVVEHARRQGQRGRNPSIAFMGVGNPRIALEIANAHVESANTVEPEEVLKIKYGSMLAWLRAKDPKTRYEFAAVSKLSDASLQVRVRVISELVEWHLSVPGAVEEGETAFGVVKSNMIYVTSEYTLGRRQQWAEALNEFQPPAMEAA